MLLMDALQVLLGQVDRGRKERAANVVDPVDPAVTA